MKKLIALFASLVLATAGANAGPSKKGRDQRQEVKLAQLEGTEFTVTIGKGKSRANYWKQLANKLRKAGYYKVNGLLTKSTQAQPKSPILSRKAKKGDSIRVVVKNGLLVVVPKEVPAKIAALTINPEEVFVTNETTVPVATVSTSDTPMGLVEPELPSNSVQTPETPVSATSSTLTPVATPAPEAKLVVGDVSLTISDLQSIAQKLSLLKKEEQNRGKQDFDILPADYQNQLKSLFGELEKTNQFLSDHANEIGVENAAVLNNLFTDILLRESSPAAPVVPSIPEEEKAIETTSVIPTEPAATEETPIVSTPGETKTVGEDPGVSNTPSIDWLWWLEKALTAAKWIGIIIGVLLAFWGIRKIPQLWENYQNNKRMKGFRSADEAIAHVNANQAEGDANPLPTDKRVVAAAIGVSVSEPSPTAEGDGLTAAQKHAARLSEVRSITQKEHRVKRLTALLADHQNSKARIVTRITALEAELRVAEVDPTAKSSVIKAKKSSLESIRETLSVTTEAEEKVQEALGKEAEELEPSAV
jgi:hypothetical protein